MKFTKNWKVTINRKYLLFEGSLIPNFSQGKGRLILLFCRGIPNFKLRERDLIQNLLNFNKWIIQTSMESYEKIDVS